MSNVTCMTLRRRPRALPQTRVSGLGDVSSVLQRGSARDPRERGSEGTTPTSSETPVAVSGSVEAQLGSLPFGDPPGFAGHLLPLWEGPTF